MKMFSVISILCFALISQAKVHVRFGDVTDNPQNYVLTHSQNPSKGLTQFDCSTCTSMKDLVFIAPTSECGTNGCFFYVFKPSLKSYKLETAVFLRTNAFQLLPSKTNGWNDFLFYQTLNSTDGLVVKNQFNGKKYVGIGKAQKIKNAELKKYLTPEAVTKVYFDKNLKKIASP